MKFYLMNKDTPIALISCIENSIEILDILDKRYIRNMEDSLWDINTWLDRRITPLNRHNILKLQKISGITNKESLLNISKGISINDTIWFNSIDNEVSWKDINPYKNTVDVEIANLVLNGKHTDKRLDIPCFEYFTGGSFEKCCLGGNNELYLVKNSGEKFSSITGNGAESEIIYTQLCEALEVKDYTEYWMEKDNGIEYSVCKLFTDEDTGYIEFGDSKYKEFGIEDCIDTFGNKFRDIVILDTITFNVDRHRGNYGFLINNNTFEILDIAPNFDYNLSCLYGISMKESREALNTKLVNLHNTSMGNSFLELAKLAMYDNMKNKIKHLVGEFKLDLSRLGDINKYDDNRSEMLELILNTQMRRILKYIEKG